LHLDTNQILTQTMNMAHGNAAENILESRYIGVDDKCFKKYLYTSFDSALNVRLHR